MPEKPFDILAKLKCKFNFKIPVRKQSKGKGRKKISSLAKSEKIEPETPGGSRALPKSVEPHSELECYTTATSSSTRSNRLQKPTAGTQVPDLRGDIERILAEQGLPLHNFGANAPKEGSDRIQATIDPALLSDNDLPADWRNEPIFDDPSMFLPTYFHCNMKRY
ncbi:hypothetical protein PtA15_11A220 [Puccinia triticina]|uniref:Uncharacterized protein n=1 Tax=Puccinia triticina TaxID=208348 RepID=A0ABY7CZI9_9BASI|nr:uncharacterized protein PtA15_11A220 [Puccinia triticina]WAQ89531.1 hypothetical protein PtA15_11A220 [Puccinia triticina]